MQMCPRLPDSVRPRPRGRSDATPRWLLHSALRKKGQVLGEQEGGPEAHERAGVGLRELLDPVWLHEGKDRKVSKKPGGH